MFYYLRGARRVSIVQGTSNVLGRLIAVIMETCLACTTVAIALLLLFVTFRDTMIYVVPVLMIGKLYANSILAVCSFPPSVSRV